MIRFSKDYSKLGSLFFSTIRKASPYYRIGAIHKIKTPTTEFKAQIVAGEIIGKGQISEELAQSDADCSKEELIAMLERWYGREFNDFVLFSLKRVA